jgi:hypothetical protein
MKNETGVMTVSYFEGTMRIGTLLRRAIRKYPTDGNTETYTNDGNSWTMLSGDTWQADKVITGKTYHRLKDKWIRRARWAW